MPRVEDPLDLLSDPAFAPLAAGIHSWAVGVVAGLLAGLSIDIQPHRRRGCRIPGALAVRLDCDLLRESGLPAGVAIFGAGDAGLISTRLDGLAESYRRATAP